jgi:hypothetical protein
VRLCGLCGSVLKRAAASNPNPRILYARRGLY